MNNDSVWAAFLMGGLVTAVLLMILANLPTSLLREAKDKKAKCELVIPRNQECVMVFVPKKQIH